MVPAPAHAGGEPAAAPPDTARLRKTPLGTPGALRAELGPDATLDDVFRHHTGDLLADQGSLRDVRVARRTAGRLG